MSTQSSPPSSPSAKRPRITSPRSGEGGGDRDNAAADVATAAVVVQLLLLLLDLITGHAPGGWKPYAGFSAQLSPPSSPSAERPRSTSPRLACFKVTSEQFARASAADRRYFVPVTFSDEELDDSDSLDSGGGAAAADDDDVVDADSSVAEREHAWRKQQVQRFGG